MNKPITALTLTLYKKNQPVRELNQSILPWGILELAIDLQEALEDVDLDNEGKVSNISKEKVSMLTDFVVYVFEDDVTKEELNRGASLEDMFALYQQIFVMVSQIMKKNPTIGQAMNRKSNLKSPAQ